MEPASPVKHVITIRWGREMDLEESSFDDSSLDMSSYDPSPQDELQRLCDHYREVLFHRDALQREAEKRDRELDDILDQMQRFKEKLLNK